MRSTMQPGNVYCLRSQSTGQLVDGVFIDSIFYEGLNRNLRAGFVDSQSRLFYRHGILPTEDHSRTDLSGKILGMVLVGLSGELYHLVKVES
jgi:hypothetical protein